MKLAMGSTQGKIQLALRNTVDTDDTMPAGSAANVALRSGSSCSGSRTGGNQHVAVAKAAPPPPPTAYQVEIISGNKRETKSFTEQ